MSRLGTKISYNLPYTYNLNKYTKKVKYSEIEYKTEVISIKRLGEERKFGNIGQRIQSSTYQKLYSIQE
jgi:hypothetical protein